jgi:hypothetical protein
MAGDLSLLVYTVTVSPGQQSFLFLVLSSSHCFSVGDIAALRTCLLNPDPDGPPSCYT